MRIWSKVDLPLPFPPTMKTTSPIWNSIEMGPIEKLS